MRHTTLALSLVLTLAASAIANAADGPLASKAQAKAADAPKQVPEKGVVKFMRAKLASSQKILEGLVTEDYKLIAKGAENLKVMSRAAEWQVFRDPTYQRHSDTFRRAANDMIKQAKAENVDGATLTYVRVTMSCVNCHNYVRSVRTVKLENRDSLKHVARLLPGSKVSTTKPVK